METAHFRLFCKLNMGKKKFVFLGRQIINGDKRFFFSANIHPYLWKIGTGTIFSVAEFRHLEKTFSTIL
jgi:hypothetical protein